VSGTALGGVLKAELALPEGGVFIGLRSLESCRRAGISQGFIHHSFLNDHDVA
jgi:hypothetical protein